MSLQIKDLHKSYVQAGVNIEVLKGLNLNIELGQSVAILGHSGSGKSTFLSLLAGLDKPNSGSIVIKGQDIVRLNESQMTEFRAKNIGIVFQQFHLLPHLTAFENILVPLEILGQKEAVARALKALESVQLAHRKNHLPHQLSGGECQRVAIARAIVSEPQILLADEPSGNLDDETGDKVMNYFFEIIRRNKITTIFVTHNQDLARRCDRRYQLANGLL